MSPCTIPVQLFGELAFTAVKTAFFAWLAFLLLSDAPQQYTPVQEVHTDLLQPMI